MRIAYYGNFRPQHSTENHLALTLEDMGHEVVRIQEDGPQSLVVSELMLWTRTWPGFVTDETLEWYRRLNIPTVSYHLDLYVGIQRESTLDTDPFWHTDYVFTPDGDPHSAEIFKSKGINHHWLKPGVFKLECKKGNFRPEYEADIAFIGTVWNYHPEWPYREKLVNWLAETYGKRFKIYGKPPYPQVRNQELNDVLASTKIIIGDSLCKDFTHEKYWSDRVYETTGRGGFIIHPYIRGLDAEFADKKEIVFYPFNDFTMLQGLINFYLENDHNRELVRDRGMKRTKAEHTYHNRLEEMLNVVNQT